MNNLEALLPIAVGMMISPFPIVAIVAIVLAPRGRSSAPVFTATFTAVSIVLIALGAFGSSRTTSGHDAGSSVVSEALAILLAIGFAIFAIVSWTHRPKNGAPAVAPKWLAAIDTITPSAAISLGLVMAVTNTKNVPLALKAGSIIGAAHTTLPVAVALCLVVAVVGSLALIVPGLIALSRSERVRRGLQSLKGSLIAHNAGMMTALFAILAANEAAQVVGHLLH